MGMKLNELISIKHLHRAHIIQVLKEFAKATLPNISADILLWEN